MQHTILDAIASYENDIVDVFSCRIREFKNHISELQKTEITLETMVKNTTNNISLIIHFGKEKTVPTDLT